MNRLIPSLLALMFVNVTFGSQRLTLLKAAARCPTEASIERMDYLAAFKDLSMCAIGCAESNTCCALHFMSTNLRCYLANETTFLVWNAAANRSDGCVSFVKQVTTTEATSSNSQSNPTSADTNTRGLISSKFNKLRKLIVFFDFRQGYSNIASSESYNATPRGSVTQDGRGAKFSGNSTDYIEVDTNNNTLASTYLDYHRKFSFFARVQRQANYKQNYHYFHNCFGNLRGEFYDADGRIGIKHGFSNQTNVEDKSETIQSNGTLVPVDNTPFNVSAAATFIGNRFEAFYFNGNISAGGADLKESYLGLPMCLRLGYHPNPGSSLKGFYVCYGIANVALALDEFAELSHFCGG